MPVSPCWTRAVLRHGHTRCLSANALRGRNRDQVLISVKFGGLRDPDGGWGGNDGRPVAVKNFLAYSLRRLGTDYGYLPAGARRTRRSIEDTVGAIADMITAGHVRHIGLSEAGAATLRRAQAVHPIVDLQIEYSLFSRSIEAEILPVCRELGIGITAYGVLSRGLLSGHWSKDRATESRDFRARSPRFSGDNLDRNLALVEALRAIADEKGIRPVSRSPSPGSWHAAEISCRWWGRAAATAWTRRWVRSTSISLPAILPA